MAGLRTARDYIGASKCVTSATAGIFPSLRTASRPAPRSGRAALLSSVVFDLDPRKERVAADMRANGGATALLEGALQVADRDGGGVLVVDGRFALKKAPVPFAERLLPRLALQPIFDELSECIEPGSQ